MDNRAKNLIEWSGLVKERDGYTCQVCGTMDEVIAHHIQPILDKPGKALVIENGQALCRTCHIQLHNAQKPSPSCFPREYSIIEGRFTWKPIIPDSLKHRYPQYVGV